MITPDKISSFTQRHLPVPPPVAAMSLANEIFPRGICSSPETLSAYLENHGVKIKSIRPQADGITVLILDNCPFNSDHGHGTDTAVVLRSDGKPGFQCKHNGCATYRWRDFREKIDPDYVNRSPKRRGHAHQLADPDGPSYANTREGLVWHKPSGDGIVPVPLTNFGARIVGDVVRDDGVETSHLLEIETMLHGRQQLIQVPSGRFGGMNWVLEHLGPTGIIYPGQALRDHARAGIQLTSGAITTRRVFAHTGWRQIDGEWMYLHAGGAISAAGPISTIEVDTHPKLADFSQTANCSLVDAVRDSLQMLDVAPDRISVPIWAAVYRAPLGPCDLSIHLAGRSGAGKSELAALAQQHYGAYFDRTHLPCSWSSTANALESVSFTGKDMVLVVDDFAPTGGTHDIARTHREADRLFRAQGNHAGRQRMSSDSSLRAHRYPRGLILSTGEDVPRGESLRARLVVAEVSPGDMCWSMLTECQRHAADGVYALSMRCYIQWLAGRYAQIIKGLSASVADFRQLLQNEMHHKRTPTSVAQLAVGIHCFLRFAQESGAITQDERDELWNRCWNALLDTGASQAQHVSSADPVKRFVDLMSAAIASGHAHFAAPSGAAPPDGTAQASGWRKVSSGSGAELRPLGDRIGWIDGDDLYLEPEASYRIAQQMAGAGESIPVSSRTLHRRLLEAGVLVTIERERGKLTKRRSLEGTRRNVLHVRRELLIPLEGQTQSEVMEMTDHVC